jgi:hypothetical protein
MRAPDGQWVVLIPEDEVLWSASGAGTYSLEKRDGTSQDVVVTHVSQVVKVLRGVRYRCGIPERTQHDRSVRVNRLSHAPSSPHGARLSPERDQVIAPVSVLDRVARRSEPVEVDGLRVWVDADERWRTWSHQGVRMARAPIVAAKAL